MVIAQDYNVYIYIFVGCRLIQYNSKKGYVSIVNKLFFSSFCMRVRTIRSLRKLKNSYVFFIGRDQGIWLLPNRDYTQKIMQKDYYYVCRCTRVVFQEIYIIYLIISNVYLFSTHLFMNHSVYIIYCIYSVFVSRSFSPFPPPNGMETENYVREFKSINVSRGGSMPIQRR